MSGCISPNIRSKPMVFERIEKSTGFINVSPKHSLSLMQNCDLPPPAKLFSGPDKAFLPSIMKNYKQETMEDEFSTRNEKWELLKALRLSQTRAREAERKSAALSKEKDVVSNLLIEESLSLFAHRRWVELMELQILRSERQNQENKMIQIHSRGKSSRTCDDHEEDPKDNSSKWFAAIALCLAIAGMGIAIGFKNLF